MWFQDLTLLLCHLLEVCYDAPLQLNVGVLVLMYIYDSWLSIVIQQFIDLINYTRNDFSLLSNSENSNAFQLPLST